MMNVDVEKWRDLNDNLVTARRHEDRTRSSRTSYLVDDFTASGTTFIRQVDGKWKGKLKKFNDIVIDARTELGAEVSRSPTGIRSTSIITFPAIRPG